MGSVLFYCNLNAFVCRFQHSRIRVLCIFMRAERFGLHESDYARSAMPRPVTEMFNALYVVINRDIFLPSTPFLLLMLCNKKCLKCITST